MQGTGTIQCDNCGKQFRWREEIAGKRMKCPCGGIVSVPANAPDGAVPAQVGAAGAAKAQAARSGGAPRVNAAAIMAAKGLPPPRGRTKSQRELDNAKSGQEELEEMAKTNLLRDVIIPIPIILAGLALSYLNVTQWPMPGKQAAPPSQALGMVAVGAATSVVLVVGAIFLTTVLADVTFVGKFHNTILRLCAIAIGPSAIYAIMAAVVGGDDGTSMAGTALGALLTIVALAALYWGLMRLD